MFLNGQYVKSVHHGLGRVVAGGIDPIVRFMNGPELQVAGATLYGTPQETYEAELANLADWNRYLDRRICGTCDRRPLLPRPPFDVERALKETFFSIRRATTSLQSMNPTTPAPGGRLRPTR